MRGGGIEVVGPAASRVVVVKESGKEESPEGDAVETVRDEDVTAPATGSVTGTVTAADSPQAPEATASTASTTTKRSP